MDVDHFKAFNDHCGHQRGDDCLRRVARLLVAAAGRRGRRHLQDFLQLAGQARAKLSATSPAMAAGREGPIASWR
ncbi:MAG: diguanylate cyclase [Pseudolabrys sp.]